jgi:hypothetical protein
MTGMKKANPNILADKTQRIVPHGPQALDDR